MLTDLKFLLVPKTLYQKAVEHFSGQEVPVGPLRRAAFPNGLRFERLNGKTADINWADLKVGISRNTQLACHGRQLFFSKNIFRSRDKNHRV